MVKTLKTLKQDDYAMSKYTEAQEERALRLHKEAIVVDTHCDTLGGLFKSFQRRNPRKLWERSEEGQIDIPRLLEGGVTCQTFAIFTATGPVVPDATVRALKMVDKFYEAADMSEDFVTVTSSEEILEAKKMGKTSGLLSLEGAEPLMGDLALLRMFYKLGVRMVSFAWNYRTPFADGLGAKRAESKLPELGVEALEEMSDLGMVFDVSHLTDSVFWDVCDVVDGAFIASHSNCRALCDHARNLTDDMIKALADHGGVMGMNYVSSFVGEGEPDVARMVDHVDHIVDLVGPDHVGLGSDYDGGGGLISLDDVSLAPNMTREMVSRGYEDEDILKILGGNHMRVFKEVLG